ncbi:DUF5343 domain-containing protein [Rhodococcus sp. H36-A4]|uniref:DUF5343 domain-containing protein n=1 Tax=Rhodococcus sp. H36-A4 TaxID=3004353 RepID=UPI0022AF2D96|nr:DUF5343 domain-containing protein [Rhodococcus sp. H36-A4]MCZ4076557.1 DUF5343 domain-containing protein [Rhodococcus sp. H36-A4]
MTETAPKRSYPYLGATAWGDLHRRLRGSIPKAIDKDYLHTVLGISDKAAANLIPQLKTVGLIDDDLKPTELVNDFRDDEQYAQACAAIVQRVYPSSLLDAINDPAEEVDAAVRWFMRQGTGETTAKAQAKFFVLLHDQSPPEAGDKPKKQSAPTKKSPTAETRKIEQPDTIDRSVETTSSNADSKPTHTATPPDNGKQIPSLHLDIQVHIAADADPQQIDAIFASMAKHLYGK